MKTAEKIRSLLTEVKYKATTSGGKGGQNVNKVATRVELYFDINASQILTDDERKILLKKLINKVSEDGVLRITSSEERTQFKNKKLAGDKFIDTITKALAVRKKRKATKPSAESVESRIRDKKILSEKKKSRSKQE